VLVAARAAEAGGSGPGARGAATGLALRPLRLARRAAGEAALWAADPLRLVDFGRSVAGTLARARSELAGPARSPDDGSPLWRARSRHRHLGSIRLPLDEAKAAGKALGGSINDVFVTGAVEGALRYHEERSTPVGSLLVSFVISTRTEGTSGANAFTPARMRVTGSPLPLDRRFAEVRDVMASRREGARATGALSGLAGLANALPTPVVTRLARSQAAGLDFATSNLRAAPMPVYMSGARVLHNVPMGPVAGTAFNLTTLSYAGSLDMGLLVDPRAVEDPAGLRAHIDAAYTDLLAAGGVVRSPGEAMAGA